VRILIGGVAYRNLRDHSFGVLLVEALAAHPLPAGVSVEDISYNPIAVVQRLEDDPPEARFGLAIVAGAVERGRPAGTLAAYRWDNALPDADTIQAAVAEAVTGVIALDNTLVIARHFGALPAAAVIVEVEPEVHAFGSELSPQVAEALERACDLVTRLALDPAAVGRLPERPLGGGAFAGVRHAGPQVGDVVFRLR
jgi:hydrogenase maturation protease